MLGEKELRKGPSNEVDSAEDLERRSDTLLSCEIWVLRLTTQSPDAKYFGEGHDRILALGGLPYPCLWKV